MAVQNYEQIVAWGKVAQSNLTTPNNASQMIRFSKLNADLGDPTLTTESDAAEIGKGHEWAEEQYNTFWNVDGTLDVHLSSEAAAIWLAFCLGNASVAAGPVGTGSYIHTIKFANPVTTESELKAFSVLEQERPGGSPVTDRVLIGCVADRVVIALTSGPNRDAAKITLSYVGTGKFTAPSSITAPAKTTPNLLPSAGMTLTLNGVDYVGNKTIENIEFEFANNVNLDAGFFPGSGFQTPNDGATGAVRGRMEHGARLLGIRLTVRARSGSDEVTKLKAQTEGTLAFKVRGALISGSTYHQLEIDCGRVRFASVERTSSGSFGTFALVVTPLYDTDDLGPCVAKVTNTLPLVGAEV